MSVRRRWFVLGAWIALFIGINIASFSIGSSYSNSFSLPGTNSTHALHLLQKGFKSKAGDSDDIVFAVTKGTIESHESTIDAMLAKVAKLKEVASVVSPFCTSNSASCPGQLQLSPGHKIAYAVVDFTKQANLLKKANVRAVQNTGETIRSSSLEVEFGGNAFEQLNSPTGSPG
ncbi:MAG TPA: MMPL family transporter, partial [Acidimicrobiales bacterium]